MKSSGQTSADIKANTSQAPQISPVLIVYAMTFPITELLFFNPDLLRKSSVTMTVAMETSTNALVPVTAYEYMRICDRSAKEGIVAVLLTYVMNAASCAIAKMKQNKVRGIFLPLTLIIRDKFNSLTLSNLIFKYLLTNTLRM